MGRRQEHNSCVWEHTLQCTIQSLIAKIYVVSNDSGAEVEKTPL